MAERLPTIFLLALLLFLSRVLSMSIFTIENKCNYTVWPAIFSWQSQVSTTGFTLRSGEARALLAPSSWRGLISGRTLCSNDSTGKFSCITGDCESGKIECPRTYSWSQVTYVFLGIDNGGIDTYNISVEYGYNLPIKVVPAQSSSRRCMSSSCVVDLNKTCPNDLKKLVEGKTIGCSSACRKVNTSETCCSHDFKSKQKCKPTLYTQNFERVCPFTNRTFVCPNSTDYVITFCPSSSLNNTRINNRSSVTPLAGPKHSSRQKLKPILGTTFIATTSLLLIHIS
ncbi:PR5-like receptor kinase [Cardamine amara subsp. amara]|uniref:PR5-like receptor kinase n=1 Tax=Cardamine amara subsp. amara TaxID=228776 RepID=A0ABD1B452_CARAN